MSDKAKIKHFTISGSIRERESGRGVRGLMVKAYDKDLMYDDLLGSVISDQDGNFSISYSEHDFAALFKSKPDIYLVVYAPPYRRLAETQAKLRWEDRAHKKVELLVDREKLRDLSPTRPTHVVEGGVSLGKDALTIMRRDGFDFPRIEGFVNRGLLGAPALPEKIQQLVLPRGSRITNLEIELGEPLRRQGPLQIFPAQNPIPDVGTDPKQFRDGVCIDNTSVRFTAPSPKYYESKQAPEHKFVEVLGAIEIGPVQFVSVRVRPVQYDPTSKTLIFYPTFSYRARFDTKEPIGEAPGDKDEKKFRITFHQAEFLQAVLEQEVVYLAKDWWQQGIWQFLPEEYPHVIITDNYQWPESIDLGGGLTRSPNLAERGGQLQGNILGEFERLAKWKSQRGVRSRVVAISEIVAGQFGDFTQGRFARDLQEVLRNFIKFIHQEWGTMYVLLGGDMSVVPMRRLAGCNAWYAEFGCLRFGFVTKGGCFPIARQNAAKLWPDFQPAQTDPLSTFHSGVLVPFDRQAGPNRLGWYYTTENDFHSLNTGFTRLPTGQTSQFIIVEGPASTIDDDYYWVRDVNSIPSDLYYASLTGDGYSVPGQHDFDANDNGIYGQFGIDSQLGISQSLDGALAKFDIFVGRASVENATEAQGFVDKVITYERLEAPSGASVDTSYIAKVLYAADYFYRWFQHRQANTANHPAPGMFTHVAGTQITKITTSFQVNFIGTSRVPEFRLIARQNDRDVLVSHHLAFQNQPVWHFMTDDTFGTKSTSPTRFVLVEGPEAEVNPDYFFWDPVGIEQATEETEHLRTQMNQWFPNINSVQRFYWDYFPPIASPPHVEAIKQSPLLAALDAGVHFVSLKGHGSPGGCCYVGVDHNFGNANEYSVVFADSCSTARPDYVFDSLAEQSTIQANGGAVAYVGNTRYGWLGSGRLYEEAFWKGLYLLGRIGPAAASRWTLGLFDMWTFYAQNLFGDPEMPVWTAPPANLAVSHPSQVAWGNTFTVAVALGAPVSGARVTVMGGWTRSSLRPRVLTSKVTEAAGVATFRLLSSSPALSELTVTVTMKNCKSYVGKINITFNTLDAWLVANPRIANAIQWENAMGFRTLPNWTSTERDALREAYRLAEQDNSLALADPPANQVMLGDNDFPTTVLRSEDAWPLFLAHVAHALHLEIGGDLGWSVRNYGDPELAVLFNSKYYFEWDAQRGGYNLSRTRVGAAAAGWPSSRGNSLLAPPKLVYDFLAGNNLIAGDRLQTIGRVLEWSRQNLMHFIGALKAGNAENQWQYRGLPPVSRILTGTPNDAYPADGIRHRTAGCHGTNGFLKDVLRVVNIPMLYHSPEGTGHATPHFLSEARYLSHGDDPYNAFARGNPPPYSATELLIDAAQFDVWFGDAVPDAERLNNIGRRVYELALQYLPDYLLQLHCQDLAAGRAHNASSVYDSFKRWYTVADLEAKNLWSRMDQRIAERGGCDNIP